MRRLCQERFYHLQGVCICLWICITCMSCFLICHQLMLFQNKKTDILKMLGMSNFSVFFVNMYETRYIYIFIMSLFAVLNIFLTPVPVIPLMIIENAVYWYIYVFLYFVKTWHYHRAKFGKFFYWIKRVIMYLSFLGLVAFIFFRSQMQAILRTQKRLECLEWHVVHITAWANQLIGMILILSYIFGTELFYLNYIRKHAIFAEEDRDMNTFSRGASYRDAILKFRGKRFCQLIKMNYILYTRNWNCFVSKMVLGGIWILVVSCTDNKHLCFGVGMLVISTVSALVFYRIRDDLYNLKLYETLGYTVKWMFWNHCICAFSYLYTCTFIGIGIGLVLGSLSPLYAIIMVLWMIYQTIFFTSFNFYFLYVKGISGDSQLYEPFACFGAIAIAESPLSIVFPLLFFRKMKNWKIV